MKKLTEDFNKVTVAKGETFSIELDSVPSAGYSWDLKLKAGKASLVKEDWVSDQPLDEEICGGGKEVFVYKAEAAGTIEIEAEYKRSWEKTTPPLKSQRFNITVK